jgi:hypothetical protein
MLGFKRFDNAVVTICGIELAEKIKKGQFKTSKLGRRNLTDGTVERGTRSLNPIATCRTHAYGQSHRWAARWMTSSREWIEGRLGKKRKNQPLVPPVQGPAGAQTC